VNTVAISGRRGSATLNLTPFDQSGSL
jgi:hypothetical protein